MVRPLAGPRASPTPAPIGMVVRALGELGFATPETRATLLAALGWSDAVPARPTLPVIQPPPRAPSRRKTSKPRTEAPSQERKPLPSTLTELGTPAAREPTWLANADPLPLPDPVHAVPAYAKPIEPLFSPHLARAIVTRLASAPAPVGEVDVPRLVETVATGRPLKGLPRRSVPTLAKGLDLLIDDGRGLEPFANDIAGLIDELSVAVGRDRVRIRLFQGCPSSGVMDPVSTKVAAYDSPPVGTPVLVVSDLGVGERGGRARRGPVEDWLVFAADLRSRGNPLTVLMPGSPARAPAALHQALAPIPWDRQTGARLTDRTHADTAPIGRQDGAERLARLASIAGRIDPQLLRALRLELAPDVGIEAEADLWFSDLTRTASVTGVVLNANDQRRLQDELASDPTLLTRAFEVLYRLRTDRSWSERGKVRDCSWLLAQEELTYHGLRGLEAGGPDRAATEHRLIQILKTLVSAQTAERERDAVVWTRSAKARLPAAVMDLEPMRHLLIGAARRGADTLPPSDVANAARSEDTAYLTPGTRRTTLSVWLRLVEGGLEASLDPMPEAHRIHAPALASLPLTIEGEAVDLGSLDPISAELTHADREDLATQLKAAEQQASSDPDNAERQRDLLDFHKEIGDAHMAEGNALVALQSYHFAQAIAERLVAADPGNAEWLHALSMTHNRIGDVHWEQGELAAALRSYEACHAIANRLTESDPNNASWLRDLSVSHERIGNVRWSQGELAAALERYRACQAISEQLMASDPGNAGWQRDLLVSYERIGDVREAQGDLDAALESYSAAHAIAERLAAADPNNDGWQRDLLVSHNKIGDMRVRIGDLEAALESFTTAQVIAERLVASDPGNAGRQHDLSVSHNKIGDALLALGDLTVAETWYLKSLESLEALGNSRSLAHSYEQLAMIARNRGDSAAAESWNRKASEVGEALQGRSGMPSLDHQHDLFVQAFPRPQLAAGGEDDRVRSSSLARDRYPTLVLNPPRTAFIPLTDDAVEVTIPDGARIRIARIRRPLMINVPPAPEVFVGRDEAIRAALDACLAEANTVADADPDRPLRVFVSYAHADSEARETLETLLKPLEQDGLIEVWIDHRIEADDSWLHQFAEQLGTADIYVLLVSPAYLMNPWAPKEIEIAVDRSSEGSAHVIPVIIQDCDWENSPLGDLSVLRSQGRPVMDQVDATSRTMAWLDIAQDLETAIRNRRAIRQSPQQLNTEPRLVVLAGPEGIGRFTLARRVVHEPEVGVRYPDGIIWLGEDGNGYPRQWLRDYCSAIGEAAPFDDRDVIDAVAFHDLFANRRVLFIADHYTASDVLPMLMRDAGPRCTIIVIAPGVPDPADERTTAIVQQPLSLGFGAVWDAFDVPSDAPAALINFAVGNPLLLKLARAGAMEIDPDSLHGTTAARFHEDDLKRPDEDRRAAALLAWLWSKDLHIPGPDIAPGPDVGGLDARKRLALRRVIIAHSYASRIERSVVDGMAVDVEGLIRLGLIDDLGRELRLHPLVRRTVPEIDPDTVDVLAMLRELHRSETTHERRKAIGERLDRLGDPRRGVGVGPDGTPEIDWCLVPSGRVTLEDAEGTSRQVEKFHVSRFPVTVAQYGVFMAANDGWRDRDWWEPDLYRDAEGNTYDFGRFGNEPAVYVSWFDAVAFCRWLSRRLGYEVRLPDEWEWQQAATGGDDGTVYPWGPDWDAWAEPWRANTFESRLRQATAVGMYPAGASPTGTLDMGGTVWEWCRNKFKHLQLEETRSQSDDLDPRVLRGGSWLVNPGGARAANRNGSVPNSRFNNIGFRVVCSSPSPGTES